MPAERKVFVYRLDVTYPPCDCTPVPYVGMEERVHMRECATRGRYIRPGWGDTEVWRTWPRPRVYLSSDAAHRQAVRLRDGGCTVAVERSHPVQWPW